MSNLEAPMMDTTFAIIDLIEKKELKSGDKLPSIGELAKMWGCNHSQVRTGLIIVSALGLIETHPRSGSFVRTPDNQEIEKIFTLLVRLTLGRENPVLLNLYELKCMIDEEIFRVAATNRNDTEVVILQEVLTKQRDAIDSARDFVRLDEDFHVRVAEIARNPLLTRLLELVQAMVRSDRIARQTREMRDAIINEHQELYFAIRDQDVDRATELGYHHANRRRWQMLQSV